MSRARHDSFADPMDFCRTCRGFGRLGDGLPCDVCGGHGAKTVKVIGGERARMTMPEERKWRCDNPRCACGADQGLTMISEGYHPEPPIWRCETCITEVANA